MQVMNFTVLSFKLFRYTVYLLMLNASLVIKHFYQPKPMFILCTSTSQNTLPKDYR